MVGGGGLQSVLGVAGGRCREGGGECHVCSAELEGHLRRDRQRWEVRPVHAYHVTVLKHYLSGFQTLKISIRILPSKRILSGSQYV